MIPEIPWQIHRISTATNGSRYMLGSSLHWSPILNGYTGYPPPTYHFVQRVAQALPNPDAIEKLQRLMELGYKPVQDSRLVCGRFGDCMTITNVQAQIDGGEDVLIAGTLGSTGGKGNKGESSYTSSSLPLAKGGTGTGGSGATWRQLRATRNSTTASTMTSMTKPNPEPLPRIPPI